MIQAVERGWRVVLVCATGGEAGEISDPTLATPETLGLVRAQELHCACDVLGVSDLVMLGYCDSGMAGTPENERPSSFVQAEPQTVVARLIDLMMKLRPTVTVTFEPNGVYGHPDHIAISRHATAAFDQFAAGVEDAGRLFYGAIPLQFFRNFQTRAASMGIEMEESQEMIESFKDIDRQITHRVDISTEQPRIFEALRCHRTQIGGGNMFDLLLLPQFHDLQSHEHYIQVRPAPDTDGEVATSLLE